MNTPDFDEIRERYEKRAAFWLSDADVIETLRKNREILQRWKQERMKRLRKDDLAEEA